jgi:hypothetical protein
MHNELTKLLGTQADKLYPMELANAHPRIIDRIVSLWSQGTQLETYLNELLIDERGNRAGFSPPIILEILALKNYILALRKPPERNANTWGELTDIDRAIRQERGSQR